MPGNPWLAVANAAIFVGSHWLPVGSPTPGDALTSASLLAPALVYAVLWLGIHIPFHHLGSANDGSNSIYIYAYPVQVLLAIWRVTRSGHLAHAALRVLATIPLAVAGWWLIERPVLRSRKWSPLSAANRTPLGVNDPDPVIASIAERVE